jgi:hypothetical protein
MSYAKAVKKYEDDGGSVSVRTDYACKAHGCPNAGSMEDFCYFHWKVKDQPEKWAAITHQNRMNFDERRNWGQFSPERQAMHRAASQKLMQDLKDGKR